MRKPFYKIVDGTEAIAGIAYRLNDLILIDPALPPAYFQEGLDAWVREKRRNLHDRIPEVAALSDDRSLLASDKSKTIFATTERLPTILKALREIPSERRPQTIIVASEKGALPDGETEEVTLFSGSIQEAADFCVLASMAAGPIIHLFDSDRLSREIQKIDSLSDDDLRALVEKKKAGDLSAALRRFAEWTGRSYQPFDYEGSPEAEKVVVAMGPEAGSIRDAIRLLRGEGLASSTSRSERCAAGSGIVTVRQLSPWDRKGLVEKIPGSVQTVFVPDRADLHFRVMDALHEGLVNRWSWFATLPKLTRIKETRYAARQIFGDIPRDDRSIEVRLDGVKPDGTLPLLRLLLNLLGESFFGQLFVSKDSTIHLRLSPDPILSNEETVHPLRVPPLDTKKIAASIGPEALPAAVLTTEILKLVVPSETNLLLEKWKGLLGEYLRPLGPFFVLQNLTAVERTVAGTFPIPDISEIPSPPLPTLIRGLALRSRIVSILDEWPKDPVENSEADALLLPLIRESELRKIALNVFSDFSKTLLPQNFRSPPSDRSLGIKPFLEKIAAIRSTTKLPLIARLSAQIVDSWVSFGVELQECGVDALEIVFEEAPWEETVQAASCGTALATARKGCQDRNEVVRRLKRAVQIPIFVSLSPFDPDIPAQVEKLKASGADAVVLFHEPEASHQQHALGWISQLSGRTTIPLVAHGGFKTPDEVAKGLSAGAAWVQTETNN